MKIKFSHNRLMMADFIIKKIEKNLSQKDFEDIGFSKNYSEAMLDKSNFLKLKIFDLTVIQANILKQTALSKGCDCAIHAGCLNNSVEKTDAILFGTKSQLVMIAKSLENQQFKMPVLAQEIMKIFQQSCFGIKAAQPQATPPDVKSLNLQKPLVMGILNLTEDSFSDGGKYLEFDKAIFHAEEMIRQGADIIDIGAESTRPNAEEISSEIQIERIIPVLKALLKLYPDMIYSVDTRSSVVAKEVLAISKDIIINDVSGLCFDEKMADIVTENQAKVVICHSSSIPKDMQNHTDYKNVIDDIYKFFAQKIDLLTQKGLSKDNIILDLGFGFGKTVEQNFELIKRSDDFLTLGCPILAGVSRKSFIQKTVPDGDFDDLTSALCGELLLKGTKIFRVHEVKKTKDVLKLFEKLK